MEKVVDFFRLDFFFEGGGGHFYVFVSVRKAQVLSQFPLVALTTAQRFFNVHFLKCITPPSSCPPLTFLRSEGHSGAVRDVHHHPTCSLLATASYDHSVKIWEPAVN